MEASVDAPMYCSAAVAQLIADRKLAIYDRYYYAFSGYARKDIPLKIGDYFSFNDNEYIFVLTAIEKTGVKYPIKGIGIKI